MNSTGPVLFENGPAAGPRNFCAATAPRVQLALVRATHGKRIEQPHDGTVDVALTDMGSIDSNVAATELFREPFLLVVPADHRPARREAVRLHDCRDETFAGLSSGVALRGRVDKLFGTAGIRPRRGFKTGEVETGQGSLPRASEPPPCRPAMGPVGGSAEVPIVPSPRRNPLNTPAETNTLSS